MSTKNPKSSPAGKPAKSTKQARPGENDIMKSLAAQFSGTYAYDSSSNLWRRFKEGIWEPVKDLKIREAVRRAIDENFFTNFSFNFVSGVTKLLMGTMSYDSWDNEVSPNLIPFQNGTLNLSNRQFTDGHNPTNCFTWQLPFEYNPGAECPKIHKWLNEATRNDRQVIELIRAFFLAVMLGRYDLQRYLEIVGPGGSGKSTLLNLLVAMIGERNCYTTMMSQLESNRFETAAIQGKRLVMVTDASNFGGDGSVFKSITGGDPLRHEKKNQQQGDSFVFHGMVAIAANSPIRFSDTSSAIPRRRISIAFDNVTPIKHRRDLSVDFKDEIPGLLNWVLGMSISDMENILRNTDTMVKAAFDAKRQTLTETNAIIAWLSENVEFSPGARTRVGMLGTGADRYATADQSLYPNFVQWCEQNGRKGQVNKNNFSRQLEEAVTVTLGVSGVEWKRNLRVGESNGAGFIGLKIANGTEYSIVDFTFDTDGEELDTKVVAAEICDEMGKLTTVMGGVDYIASILIDVKKASLMRFYATLREQAEKGFDWVTSLEEWVDGQNR